VQHFLGGEQIMLLALAIILAVVWLMGFTVFHVASGLIHLLLVLAVIGVIVHFVRGGGTTNRFTAS
jgi:Family of unknown function (DUF5670)